VEPRQTNRVGDGGEFVSRRARSGARPRRARTRHGADSRTTPPLCCAGPHTGLVSDRRMRAVFPFLALLLAGGCGAAQAVATRKTASGTSVPPSTSEASRSPSRVCRSRRPSCEQPPSRAGHQAAGRRTSTLNSFVQTPKQTVDHPARLTFTIDADRFDDVTRGQVDQLFAFAPGGLILGPCDRSDGRADPDPCITSREFLENGDGRIVVLASEPATS
jgi:hypothetical protein